MKTPILAIVWLPMMAAGGAGTSDSAVGACFAIITQHAEESSAWYEETFGLGRRSEVSQLARFRIVELVGDGLSVELIELDAVAPRPGCRITGPFKPGFRVEDIRSFTAGLPANHH